MVSNNFRNEGDDDTAHKQLIRYAKKHCTRDMQQFLFKIRARLPALIEDIWAWEKSSQTESMEQSFAKTFWTH